MRVKNLNKAAQINCSSGSWLAYWEKISGQNAFMCFTTGCIKRPSTGGRVQKDSPTDQGWYIIPLCDDCNRMKGQDLDIWDSARLVSANVPGIPRRALTTAPIRTSLLAGAS